MAPATPQHLPKTGMPFSSLIPAITDTFNVVVAKVVVASMSASKIMTRESVHSMSRPHSFMHRAVSELRTPRPVNAQVPEGMHLTGQGI